MIIDNNVQLHRKAALKFASTPHLVTCVSFDTASKQPNFINVEHVLHGCSSQPVGHQLFYLHHKWISAIMIYNLIKF